MRELAKEILKHMYPLNSDDELIIEVILEFGKRVCELQKQECAKNAAIRSLFHKFTEEYHDVDYVFEENGDKAFPSKESVLKTKNICE